MTLGNILLYSGLAIAALSVIGGGISFFLLRTQKRRLSEQLKREYGAEPYSRSMEDKKTVRR